MSNAIQIEVSGEEQLRRRLRDLPEQIQESILTEMIETAITQIETEAKRNCRVDTGRLRSSIHTEYKARRIYDYTDDAGRGFSGDLNIDIQDNEVVVGTNVEYAKTIEARYPFLFPALERAKPELKRRLMNIIRQMR